MAQVNAVQGALAWASSCSAVIFSRANLAARASSTCFFRSGARASYVCSGVGTVATQRKSGWVV